MFQGWAAGPSLSNGVKYKNKTEFFKLYVASNNNICRTSYTFTNFKQVVHFAKLTIAHGIPHVPIMLFKWQIGWKLLPIQCLTQILNWNKTLTLTSIWMGKCSFSDQLSLGKYVKYAHSQYLSSIFLCYETFNLWESRNSIYF